MTGPPLLDDPAERARREAMAGLAHVRALEPVRTPLIAAGRDVPRFDPLDGGAGARLLLLLETPGPGRDPLRFVSQDNRTGTARNLRRFLAGAGIERADLVIWNVVPWLVHAPGARNRAVTRGEIREGVALVAPLLDLLPALRAVVLAGRAAAHAEPAVRAARPLLPVLTMPHPSPTIVCTSPAIGERIRETLTHAAALIDARSYEGDA